MNPTGVNAHPPPVRRGVLPAPPDPPHAPPARWGQTRPTIAPFPESQRDSGLQPRVARRALPWVNRPKNHNPNGVAAPWQYRTTTPLGLMTFPAMTQGSSFLATLGWRPQSRWDWNASVFLNPPHRASAVPAESPNIQHLNPHLPIKALNIRILFPQLLMMSPITLNLFIELPEAPRNIPNRFRHLPEAPPNLRHHSSNLPKASGNNPWRLADLWIVPLDLPNHPAITAVSTPVIQCHFALLPPYSPPMRRCRAALPISVR